MTGTGLYRVRSKWLFDSRWHQATVSKRAIRRKTKELPKQDSKLRQAQCEETVEEQTEVVVLFRRPSRRCSEQKAKSQVREREDAFTSTRGACAPRKRKAQHFD